MLKSRRIIRLCLVLAVGGLFVFRLGYWTPLPIIDAAGLAQWQSQNPGVALPEIDRSSNFKP